jgi:hypothetical protein
MIGVSYVHWEFKEGASVENARSRVFVFNLELVGYG